MISDVDSNCRSSEIPQNPAVVKPRLHVQWHITSRCNNSCKHCYMGDPAIQDHEQIPLSIDQMKEILNSIRAFEQTWGADVKDFYISGGDPLLHDQWENLLAELQYRQKNVSLFGNPETLTAESVKRLADLDVAFFQMSLDGLEKTHDAIRSPGSFARTLNKLDLLASNGIPGGVMFTLFPNNADELIPLLRFVALETKATAFSFDIGCQVGNAAHYRDSFSASDVSGILDDYLAEKDRLWAEGHPLVVTEKSNLLRLTRLAQGTFFPVRSSDFSVVSGCLCAWSGVSILPDGTVLACRRLPVPVGKIPQQSFETVFLDSPLMRKFRRRASFEACGVCDLYAYCRGCPAYVHSMTGNPFARNPLCFREEIRLTSDIAASGGSDPPLKGSRKAEFDLVARRFSTISTSLIPRLLKDDNTQRIFLTLVYSIQDRRAYLADPYGYSAAQGVELTDDSHVFLMQHFAQSSLVLDPPERPDILARAVVEQTLRPESRTDKRGLKALIARAWANDEFRQALIDRPKKVIEQTLGFVLPPDLDVQIHEQSFNTLHILLPSVPLGIPEPKRRRKGKDR